MTYLELKQRLAELLLMRVDKMTMATSVEARVPFLDHELVEFAMALPAATEGPRRRRQAPAQDGRRRASLAPRPRLPAASRASARRSASGSAASSASSAQREIRDSALAERGLIDYDRVDELWAAHRGGQEWTFQLWNLYNVSAWHDYWVAGRELVA